MSQQDLQVAAKLAIQYLKRHYNPDVGLILEAPKAAPNIYWVRIDNALAVEAIRPWDSAFAALLQDKVSSYSASAHGRIEVLLGVPEPEPWRSGQYRHVGTWIIEPSFYQNVDPKQTYIMTETADGNVVAGPQNFADLQYLSALNAHLKGGFWNNWFTSPSALNRANAMFNGVGFNDIVARNSNPLTYATYKLAYHIIVNKKLGKQPDPRVVQILLRMQEKQDPERLGGFYTDYDSSFDTGAHDTNTETTVDSTLAINSLLGLWS